MAFGCAVQHGGESQGTTSSSIVGTACGVELTADATGDCCVNQADYDIMRANWGAIGPVGKTVGDFNNDGVVGTQDFNILRASWMTGPGC